MHAFQWVPTHSGEALQQLLAADMDCPHTGKARTVLTPVSASVVVLLLLQALAEKGVKYTSKYTDLFNGQSLSPAFLAINPKGTVPVLVVEAEPQQGKRVIADSRCVACVLGGEGTSYYPYMRKHNKQATYGASGRQIVNHHQRRLWIVGAS